MKRKIALFFSSSLLVSLLFLIFAGKNLSGHQGVLFYLSPAVLFLSLIILLFVSFCFKGDKGFIELEVIILVAVIGPLRLIPWVGGFMSGTLFVPVLVLLFVHALVYLLIKILWKKFDVMPQGNAFVVIFLILSIILGSSLSFFTFWKLGVTQQKIEDQSARESFLYGRNSTLKTQLLIIKSDAEKLHYENYGNNYDDICGSNGKLQNADIKFDTEVAKSSTRKLVCVSKGSPTTAWAIFAILDDPSWNFKYWCIDSVGSSKGINIPVDDSAYCGGV